MEQKQYRQGDVFIERISDEVFNQSHKMIPRDSQKRIVLAEGEATGHAHAIKTPGVMFYEMPDGERYVHSEKQFKILHEEHGAILLDPGVYRIGRQREYHPTELRQVAD